MKIIYLVDWQKVGEEIIMAVDTKAGLPSIRVLEIFENSTKVVSVISNIFMDEEIVEDLQKAIEVFNGRHNQNRYRFATDNELETLQNEHDGELVTALVRELL